MNSRRMVLKAMAGGALLPPVLASAGPSQKQAPGPRAGYFPNVTLYTHDGRKVRFYDDLIRGKVVAINMMYTVCSVTCPPATANLRAVQETLGKRVGRDVFMYSLTLQPELDTPEALRDYARKFDIQPGWTLLTGKREDMDLIRRKLGFAKNDPEEDADLKQHTGMIRIGNERYDRWLMAPALGSSRQIVTKIVSVM